jgi:hypothetical protein
LMRAVLRVRRGPWDERTHRVKIFTCETLIALGRGTQVVCTKPG